MTTIGVNKAIKGVTKATKNVTNGNKDIKGAPRLQRVST